MKLDVNYGILNPSFSFSRICWRKEIKDFKYNYPAITAREEYLKNWSKHS